MNAKYINLYASGQKMNKMCMQFKRLSDQIFWLGLLNVNFEPERKSRVLEPCGCSKVDSQRILNLY